MTVLLKVFHSSICLHIFDLLFRNSLPNSDRQNLRGEGKITFDERKVHIPHRFSENTFTLKIRIYLQL